MKSHLFICIHFGHQIVEADALSASEGHSAVIGNVNAIKAQQDVPFLEGLVDWGCWLHPPDQNALLVSLSHHRDQVAVAARLHDCVIHASCTGKQAHGTCIVSRPHSSVCTHLAVI